MIKLWKRLVLCLLSSILWKCIKIISCVKVEEKQRNYTFQDTCFCLSRSEPLTSFIKPLRLHELERIRKLLSLRRYLEILKQGDWSTKLVPAGTVLYFIGLNSGLYKLSYMLSIKCTIKCYLYKSFKVSAIFSLFQFLRNELI